MWRRGRSKLEGLGVLGLTTGVTAALGKKSQMEMELKESHCGISLLMVPSPLRDGDNWRWGANIGMNRLFHSDVWNRTSVSS